MVTLLAFGVAGYILRQRVFSLVSLGKRPNRIDQPLRRRFGLLQFTLVNARCRKASRHLRTGRRSIAVGCHFASAHQSQNCSHGHLYHPIRDG